MKKLPNKILSSFLISCLTLLSISQVFGQEYNIYEVENENTLLPVYANSAAQSILNNDASPVKNTTNNREDFYDLAFKMHPTVYSKNNSVNSTYGSGEIIKLTFDDSKSFQLLEQYNNIELITITLKTEDELNTPLDLSNRENIENLKYIFVKCRFKCTKEQIKAFVKRDSNIRVFYINETPS